MSKNITVGIDLGSHLVKVMVIEHLKERDKKTSRIIGTGKAEARGIKNGYINEPEEVIRSIVKSVREAEHRSGIKIRQATLAVGGVSLESKLAKGTSIISRADNEVSSLDVQNAVRESEQGLKLLNRHVIDSIPYAYKLDGKDLYARPEGLRGVKLEVTSLFVTCINQHLEALVNSVNNAGVDVVDVIAAPLASSVAVLSNQQKTAGCILVDIGAETISLSVFEDGDIISIKVLPIGGIDITRDLALGLKITLDEAEKIKKGEITGNFDPKDVSEIVEARVTEFFEIIQKFLKKINKDGRLAGGAIIVGGATNNDTTERIAKNILNLPITMSGSLGSGVLKDPAWYVVYGLCMSGRYNQGHNNYSNPVTKVFKSLGDFFKNVAKQLMP
ncbi:MAG: cell division protein FtsA [Candidatus Paceibacterota bacterium]